MEGVDVTEEGVLSVKAVASSIHSTSVLSRGPIRGEDIMVSIANYHQKALGGASWRSLYVL